MRCVGCGAESPLHPIVIVAGLGDLEGDVVDQNARFSSHEVCEACWRDPAHRQQKLKGHFFDRSAAGVALAAAGSSTIRGS